MVKAIDVNVDGKINIEDIIIIGLKHQGVTIDRSEFLQKEFMKNYPQEVIDDASMFNPAHVRMSSEDIDKMADEVIKFEKNEVIGISAVLGMPGGFAKVAAISADSVRYYGYMLRTCQKLMYLYGFPEINTKENGGTFDSETMNILIICLGVIYGVQGANVAIKSVAAALGKGVEKKLLNAALTKGTIYPIVKSVSKWFGVKMKKAIYAGFFKNAIPVAGGITYVSFKPACDKLKVSLQDTMLSNHNNHVFEEELIIINETEIN